MFSVEDAELLVIGNISFCTDGDLYHGAESFHRVFAGSGLAGKHDGAGSLIDRIGNVRCLRTGGTGILDHGIQHLCGGDNLFACGIYLVDDLFLDHRYIFQGNLHAHIAAGDHDSVCRFDDAVDIVHALLILDLGDDVEITSSVLIQNLADLVDVRRRSGERSCDKIKTFLDTEEDILAVLLADKRHIYFYAGKIDTFLIGHNAAVLDNAVNVLSFNALDFHADQTVVDQNAVSGLYIFVEFFIGDGNDGLVSLDLLWSKGEFLTLCKSYLALFEIPDTDLRSLCIKKRGNRSVQTSANFFQPVETAFLFLVGTMRKVESGYVHSFDGKLLEDSFSVCCRTQRTNDFRSAHYVFPPAYCEIDSGLFDSQISGG